MKIGNNSSGIYEILIVPEQVGNKSKNVSSTYFQQLWIYPFRKRFLLHIFPFVYQQNNKGINDTEDAQRNGCFQGQSEVSI